MKYSIIKHQRHRKIGRISLNEQCCKEIWTFTYKPCKKSYLSYQTTYLKHAENYKYLAHAQKWLMRLNNALITKAPLQLALGCVHIETDHQSNEGGTNDVQGRPPRRRGFTPTQSLWGARRSGCKDVVSWKDGIFFMIQFTIHCIFKFQFQKLELGLFFMVCNI